MLRCLTEFVWMKAMKKLSLNFRNMSRKQVGDIAAATLEEFMPPPRPLSDEEQQIMTAYSEARERIQQRIGEVEKDLQKAQKSRWPRLAALKDSVFGISAGRLIAIQSLSRECSDMSRDTAHAMARAALKNM